MKAYERGKRPAQGFTLIELLIVVAIIAILAAIAVPNFLEAQTRARVSRVKSDFRTIATAMEAYHIDSNSYPNDSDNTIGKNGENGLARLTTPIGYLTSLAVDPFQPPGNPADDLAARNYELASGADHRGWGQAPFVPGRTYGPQGPATQPRVQSWLIISPGPDCAAKTFADDTGSNDEWPWGTTCRSYDPTNGTISDGDIYRAGGDLGTGIYFVNGVLKGRIPD